jgi:ABC-type phosphate transport system permease subunit
VPSIVFGVFGLGFFCYGLGKFIDGGPENKGITPWPPASWFLACAVLAAVATGAFFAGLAGVASRKVDRTGWKRYLGMVSIALWIVASVAFVYVVAVSPYFHGFYRAELVNSHPTYGKGGLMWSSLTLALLTLPVVIVATEEALTAVPNSMREGSYACGAGKWQTIRRIVLPRAMPGIMTGMILAMARGAGEVAPLMLVGAAKKAESPLIDFADLSGSVGYLPTGPLHVDRSFMHLGFHLFDRGFQSQNVEASVPVVYTTTLLLILIIAVLNLAATWLRGRMGRKFATGEF